MALLNFEPPPIGETVWKILTWEEKLKGQKMDWVCQVRLGIEQFVLVWGSDGSRWRLGDKWVERIG
jgi:hypothetical protein